VLCTGCATKVGGAEGTKVGGAGVVGFDVGVRDTGEGEFA